MIYYEPNKNWFRDIINLTTSWTIKKILYGVMCIGAMSTLIHFTLVHFNLIPSLHSGIFSLLGIVLSILLVFRTNTAYDRWWEGRKQWGHLVNSSRNLALQAQVILPKDDVESREFIAKNISNFSIALSSHLRKGVILDDLVLTTPAEKEELKKKQHIPGYIATSIYNRLHQIYKAGAITDADLINIKNNHEALLDVAGACERIRKTPIPFSYAVYIKVFVSLYGVMLPFGLHADFGVYAIPLTMFIFFAMLGLELMAQEIEDPFGLDCNDLPTGEIAQTIKRNVFEILECEKSVKPLEAQLYTKVF
jgi:ion channel-forming bestrophin family protein